MGNIGEFNEGMMFAGMGRAQGSHRGVVKSGEHFYPSLMRQREGGVLGTPMENIRWRRRQDHTGQSPR